MINHGTAPTSPKHKKHGTALKPNTETTWLAGVVLNCSKARVWEKTKRWSLLKGKNKGYTLVFFILYFNAKL